MSFRSVYTAFDRFPSSKGAATHIEQSVRALFKTISPGALYVLGDEKLLVEEEGFGGKIFRFSSPISNFLERTQAYGNALRHWLDANGNELQLAQFRDPWSGIPIVDALGNNCTLIYEVNGLPSVELPYHFPNISEGTLSKIRIREQRCLERADAIITPSATIANNLEKRLPRILGKTSVVPNGAEIPEIAEPPEGIVRPYLIYFGALQKWQGISTLLRAFADLQDLPLDLVIVSSNKPRIAKPWRRFANKLGIDNRINWQFQLTKPQLQHWLQHAAISLAPLTESARNLEQGCCPLKILESMAASVPVIASDLPVVRELTSEVLVQPDRPEVLAFAIRELMDNPEKRRRLGSHGRQIIQQQHTWTAHRTTLHRILSDAMRIEHG